jgi:hypothetical protein
MKTPDNLQKLKSQLLNIKKYIEGAQKISPDVEMYLQGRDIYGDHVKQVVDEVLDIIARIKKGEEPEYTEIWVKEELQNLKEQYGE